MKKIIIIIERVGLGCNQKVKEGKTRRMMTQNGKTKKITIECFSTRTICICFVV
jgi:hypothetical protein